MTSILIIEDSVIETEIYRKLLGSQYQITFKNNAEEALAIYDDESFDLIISDINLPGINGPEMVQQLKHGVSASKPIVVVVSSDKEGIDDALSAGANAWFLKPISKKTFAQSIQIVIDKTRLN